MKHTTLEDLVVEGILPNDEQFMDMLLACEKPEIVLAICHPLQQKIPYVSGASKRYFRLRCFRSFPRGYPFLQSITTPETMTLVMQSMFELIGQSKKPGFDLRSVLIQEFPFDVVRADGSIKSVVSIALGLTYAANADLDYAICLITEPSPEVMQLGHSLLTALKQRHNEIYEHRPFTELDEPLKKLNLLGEEPEKLSQREKEVLKLIADGLTSDQIASALLISVNTVAAHRKSLLVKFEAKNIADLIKKASKVFWLE